jgi:hypothetical protein
MPGSAQQARGIKVARIRRVKLAMSMSPMIGEEETQRQQEERTRRERAAREKFRRETREQLGAGARKTFKFLLGATVVLYLVMNAGHFKDLGQTLSAKVNAHSTLKQSALKYQNEVDQVAK